MPTTDSEPLPKKTRVRLTTALGGIAEGTAGTVKGTVGFSLARHRVAFDNGRLVTSVARTRLVRESEWDDFVAERERAAEAATSETPAVEGPADEPPPATGTDPPADDRLAKLLARSKAAREKAAG